VSVDHKLSDCSTIMDDHQSSSKSMAELNDVVKRARIACSSCGFEKTSKDDNVDPFDEFVCGGCAATNI
jgi:formylmethanofuran dehydrogenase subunit E